MKTKSLWIVATVMTAYVGVDGCSPISFHATTPNPTTSATTNASSPSAGAGNSADNSTVSSTGGSGGNSNGSSSTNGTTSPGQGSGGTVAGGTGASQKLVRQYMTLAESGKVLNIPFELQTSMTPVEQTWGKSSVTSAGAGLYSTYDRQHVAFGFNKGGQIFDVRSYSPDLHTITLDDIKRVLGTPGASRYTSDSFVYMYPAGPDYQLLWVFSKDKTGASEKYVDHVSAFWPQGTINLMAQNQPAPSIVIDNSPGEVGSLFTFSIQNAPTGYRLEEFEWIPKRGNAVVNTLSQAAAAGQSGGTPPVFNVSGDGQTLSFAYSSDLVGQTGHVRVIYQAASGAALMGTSEDVTLK